MKLQLPVCPHCGQKVGYVRAWFLKQEGEYRCPNCGGFSGVFLSNTAPMFGSISVVLSVLVFLTLRLITGGLPFYGVVLMALPYVLFFLAAPFLVRLRKPGTRKRPPAPPQTGTPPHSPGNHPGQGTDGDHSMRRF